MYLSKKIRPDPVRDVNFKPFVRSDYEKWSYLMVIFTHFFFWPRYLAAWFFWLQAVFVNFFVMLGVDKNNIPTWRMAIGKASIRFGAWGLNFSMGYISYKRRIYVDYSKWLGPLGPNQKVRYEGAGINICNHSCSIFDIGAMLALIPQMSGFITKSEFTGPGMTQLAPAIGLLFISRDTKIVEERKNMIETIRARQISAEEGK